MSRGSMISSIQKVSADRNGDEPDVLPSFDPQQHRMFRMAARVVHCIADVGRRIHGLSAHFQDDVAGLEAAVGGVAAGVDLRHDNALVARTRDLAGRGRVDAGASVQAPSQHGG